LWTAVLFRDQHLGAGYVFLNGWKGLLSFIGLSVKSSRRLHLPLCTELAKYCHVPCNLRHVEFELNAADFETIMVCSRRRLQSNEGLVERICAVSEHLEIAFSPTTSVCITG
jgi:hypothetical protein